MGDAIGSTLGYAVGIAVSPIPIAAVILMLFSGRARVNSVSFMFAWVVGRPHGVEPHRLGHGAQRSDLRPSRRGPVVQLLDHRQDETELEIAHHHTPSPGRVAKGSDGVARVGSGSMDEESTFGDPDPVALSSFWARAMRATGAAASTSAPPAWCFGDSAEMADDLLELVVRGPKRATVAALAEYEADGEPVPAAGDLYIVMDGSSRPRALIETTDVRIGPLSSVDEQFARDEGEGDRTRAWWLDAHTRYFARAFPRLGLEFHPDIPVVFERFALRYHED